MIRELGRAHIAPPSTPVNFLTEEVRKHVAWADPCDRDHEEEQGPYSEDVEEEDRESVGSDENGRGCLRRGQKMKSWRAPKQLKKLGEGFSRNPERDKLNFLPFFFVLLLIDFVLRNAIGASCFFSLIFL